jgi:hypothetical protein
VTGRGLETTGHIRSVLGVCARLGLVIGHGGASGHDRPDVSDRTWRLTGNDWMLGMWCPVRQTCVSGR